MSFSMEVKQELFEILSPARHCKIAELSALFSGCGKIDIDKSGQLHIKLQTESEYVARKSNLLLNRLGIFPEHVSVRTVRNRGNHTVFVLELYGKTAQKVLELLKLVPQGNGAMRSDGVVTMNTCCKRAFLRGGFLSAGSVSNPQKSYHYEISEQDVQGARQLAELIGSFGVEAKTIVRKSYHVVYVKEGQQIAELLNIMEAHKALMRFENERIVKEVRNSVNRQVNCETANLEKTANAARKQYEEIILIRDTVGLQALDENLEEIALLRLENPEASLVELGELLSPKLGKSGVNHRLKKISEFAENLRR